MLLYGRVTLFKFYGNYSSFSGVRIFRIFTIRVCHRPLGVIGRLWFMLTALPLHLHYYFFLVVS